MSATAMPEFAIMANTLYPELGFLGYFYLRKGYLWVRSVDRKLVPEDLGECPGIKVAKLLALGHWTIIEEGDNDAKH